MTREEQLDAILADFRQWLHDEQAAAEDIEENVPALPSIGVGDLVEAFTALRHELKLQTKSARGLQEQAGAPAD